MIEKILPGILVSAHWSLFEILRLIFGAYCEYGESIANSFPRYKGDHAIFCTSFSILVNT